MPNEVSLIRAVERRGNSLITLGAEKALTGTDILERARALGERIRSEGHGRIASSLHDPHELLIAILAAERAGAEIALLRDMGEESIQDLAGALGASALVANGLTFRNVPGVDRVASHFRILLSTSGTTGRPKVAAHSLDRLAGRIRQSTPGSKPARWLLTYTPASFAGLQVMLTAVLLDGILVGGTDADVTSLVGLAREHEVTHISGTPTFWRSFLVALAEAGGLPDLKFVTLGGEVASQALLDRLREAWPHSRIVHIYAATETGALFSVADGREGFPAAWLEEGIDGVSLRIEDNELLVKSPRRMEGYVRGGSGTEAARESGDWIRTGDLVEAVGDRVLFRGRVDKVINVGGAKCTPEEVEGILEGVPGVQAVRVYGLSNPITGELVAAQVVAGPDADPADLEKTIMRRAQEELPAFKVPRRITFVDEIPMTATGKTVRSE